MSAPARSASARTWRRQRIIVVAALVAALVASATVVSADQPAVAAAECGAGDAHRNALTLGSTEQTVTPCVSGTTLEITVPTSCVLTVCENKYKISEIRRHGQERVRYSDGSSEQLWHFTFKALTFTKDATMRTTDNAAGQLSILPQGTAHLGGTADDGTVMYTDVWASSGTFNITFTDLPSVLACTIPIPADSPLVEVVQGGTIRGCGLDLDVKYLVSYGPSSDGSPVRLPDTRLEVSR